MKTNDIAKGIMGIKSTVVIKFIMAMIIITSLLIGFFAGVFFSEPILDYCGIALHEEFKEAVMTPNPVVPENVPEVNE